MSELIYRKLINAGMTHWGACGVIGNLEAESSLIANIAQRGMTNLTDAEYTKKFDTNPAACVMDGVGYGLAQWTFWSRKSALSKYAKARGVSVGDEGMQIDFLVQEMRSDYPTLLNYLCSTDDMYEATSRVCKEYERPAVNNIDVRYKFAQKWDAEFAGLNDIPGLSSPIVGENEPDKYDTIIAKLDEILAKLDSLG